MAGAAIDVRELGAHTDEIVRHVRESGEEVTITIDGSPAATLGRAATVESELASENLDDAWREFLELADQIRRETPPGAESATEALNRMREERQRVLSGLDVPDPDDSQ